MLFRSQKLYRPLVENLDIGPKGIGFIDVTHEERSQQSHEEGEVIVGLFHRALKNRYMDSDGIERDMTIDDIMVVAFYNAQVNYLKKGAPSARGHDRPVRGTTSTGRFDIDDHIL